MHVRAQKMSEVGLLSFQISEIVDSIAIIVAIFAGVSITWLFFK